MPPFLRVYVSVCLCFSVCMENGNVNLFGCRSTEILEVFLGPENENDSIINLICNISTLLCDMCFCC